MGRRCAFSARKRREARRPAEVLPRVKPQRPESMVVRRRRRSKGMPRRGEFVGTREGRVGRETSGEVWSRSRGSVAAMLAVCESRREVSRG